MKIAVLGTGMVGRAIAARLLELGKEVFMGTRNPENTRTLEKNEFKMSDWLNAHPVKLLPFAEAAKEAELLINCSSGLASIAVLHLADAGKLGNKILLDIANPLDFSNGFPPSLNPGNNDSLGEEIQRTFPNLRVVKSLNTMNCEIMVNPSLISGMHHVFVSGDDETAKEEVKSILNQFGWKPEMIIDLGGIETARGTEQLLPIWLRLMRAKNSVMFNFHIAE